MLSQVSASAFDNGDLVVGQFVEFVNEAVDLVIEVRAVLIEVALANFSICLSVGCAVPCSQAATSGGSWMGTGDLKTTLSCSFIIELSAELVRQRVVSS
jgi:hypothetical protein